MPDPQPQIPGAKCNVAGCPSLLPAERREMVKENQDP